MKTYKTVFCLGFPAEVVDMVSPPPGGVIINGFNVNVRDASGLPIFGKIRIFGALALITSGIAEEVVFVGGAKHGFSEPDRLRGILISLGALDNQVKAIPSLPNTNGNIDAILAYMEENKLKPEDVGVTSNGYHLVRVNIPGVANLPAESAILAGASGPVDTVTAKIWDIYDEYGGGDFVKRHISEWLGVARGTAMLDLGTKAPRQLLDYIIAL